MSTNDQSDHFATAHIDYPISNIKNSYVQDETYHFNITKGFHPDYIFPPKYDSPDSCFPIIGSKGRVMNTDEYISKLDQTPITSGGIDNMFVAINFETSRNNYEEIIENLEIKQKDDSYYAILERRNNLGARISGIEKLLDLLLDSSQIKSARNGFSADVFKFDKEKMISKSFYALMGKNVKDIKMGENKSENGAFTTWIKKLVAPYDISREGHVFYVFSESIDSVSFSLRSDEYIKLSPMERIPDKYLPNGFDYNDITTKKLDHSSKPFIQSISLRDGHLYGTRYNDCSFRDYFSFWVKYTSSEKLQWIRIFAITSLLSFLIARIIIQLFSFGEEIVIFIKKGLYGKK